MTTGGEGSGRQGRREPELSQHIRILCKKVSMCVIEAYRRQKNTPARAGVVCYRWNAWGERYCLARFSDPLMMSRKKSGIKKMAIKVAASMPPMTGQPRA